METYKGGLKAYWRHRNYERLDVPRRRARGVIQLGKAPRRQRQWRIKPRLKALRQLAPRRLFARIRDGYVRLMLALASSRAVVGGRGGFDAFERPRTKEYDERAMVELYKELVAGGHAGAGALVALRR